MTFIKYLFTKLEAKIMLDFHGGPVFKTPFPFIFYLFNCLAKLCSSLEGGRWDLSSSTRDVLVPSAAEAQNLNCWTTRNRFHKLGDAAKKKKNKQKYLCTSTAGGTGLIPSQGTKIKDAAQQGQKKKVNF